ncbi:MAG: exonuclease domain-containing protein [Bacteroidota bacterium]
MHYVVVDIETTGGTPKSSKITEIAMYKTDGKVILDEYATLINPERKIDEYVVRLTGITDKMVETAPKFYEVAKKIIEFSEGCIFVAHNVSFDYSIVRSEFKQLGFDFRMPHLCTVRASRFIIPGHDSYSLGKLSRSLNIELKGAHRASEDALATTHIFHILFAKSEKNLQKFLQQDINPKILHPNLDLEFLDTIPDKTGIYKFYNDTNQLIYIGKSKHIKKRIEQHLRNNSTKKGMEMQKMIHKIDFELTGSELVALLLESELVKKHRPVYNTSLKKELFPYGIYSFESENAYLQLYIEQTSKKTDLPLTSFSSKIEATNFLVENCKKFTLCQKHCHLQQTKSTCFSHELKQCFGACIEKESAENYNKRVNLFIENLGFEHENFFILEHGIQKNEKIAVLVENGVYQGYGKIPYFALKNKQTYWKKFIDTQVENKDAKIIIKNYMRKAEQLNVIPF